MVPFLYFIVFHHSPTFTPFKRWCFFVNLPIGGVSLTAIVFLLKASPPLGADLTKRSPRDILRQATRLDFVGATLIAGTVTCLVLALQWGGNTKPWGDKAVIIVCTCSTSISISRILRL